MVLLTVNARIRTDLAIQPGQNVHISGALGLSTPHWVSSFSVAEDASLDISRVLLAGGALTVHGGSVSLSTVSSVGTEIFVTAGSVNVEDASSLDLLAVTVVAGTFVTDESSSCTVNSVALARPCTIRRAGSLTTESCGPIPLARFDSTPVPNRYGRIFSLYLLPTSTFTASDLGAATSYGHLCQSVGLRTVTTGYSYSGYSQAPSQCAALNCMTLAPGSNDHSMEGDNYPCIWVAQHTGWSSLVTHDPGAGVREFSAIDTCDSDGLRTNHYPSELHPVCGREHGQ
jgi:hypothetical protein